MNQYRKAFRFDVSEDDYHADKIPEMAGPCLSYSVAKRLLQKSPAHAHYAHPKLGGGEQSHSESFDLGKLAHKMLLGKGAPIVPVQATDWRTKAAKEARDAARAEGKIPVLAEQYERANTAVPIIRQKLRDQFSIDLGDGQAEMQIAWQEEAGHREVWARGMLDFVTEWRGSATIWDVKTAESAHPRACASHIIKYGYDIQHAAYTRGLATLRPELEGRINMGFIFIEWEEPYAITPAWIDGVLRERGDRLWRHAVDLWAECIALNRWPAYVDRITTIEAPPWALNIETEDAA